MYYSYDYRGERYAGEFLRWLLINTSDREAIGLEAQKLQGSSLAIRVNPKAPGVSIVVAGDNKRQISQGTPGTKAIGSLSRWSNFDYLRRGAGLWSVAGQSALQALPLARYTAFVSKKEFFNTHSQYHSKFPAQDFALARIVLD